MLGINVAYVSIIQKHHLNSTNFPQNWGSSSPCNFISWVGIMTSGSVLFSFYACLSNCHLRGGGWTLPTLFSRNNAGLVPDFVHHKPNFEYVAKVIKQFVNSMARWSKGFGSNYSGHGRQEQLKATHKTWLMETSEWGNCSFFGLKRTAVLFFMIKRLGC